MAGFRFSCTSYDLHPPLLTTTIGACMDCQIRFKERFVPLNNWQFYRMIDFGIEMAEQTALPEERPFVERMKRMNAGSFWPGRGVDITEDFKGSWRAKVLEPHFP